MTEWWTQAQAGWIGAIGGGIGALGGILGALTGFLAPRGVGRRWILGGFVALGVLGACALGVGITAFAMRQPFHVAFIPTNIGLVLVLVFGVMYFVVRRVYASHEARRMEAEALRRAT